MGWLIALAVIVLLAVLPLGVEAGYDSEGARAKLALGPLRIALYPRPKKEKKEKKKKTKGKQPRVTAQAAPEEPAPQNPPPPPKQTEKSEKPKGGSWTDFLPLVKLALEFLGNFRRKLRLDDLVLKVILGGNDPCDLAITYGRAWAALGNLMPRLEQLFVIKKRDVEIECDFTASQTTVIAHLELTVTLGRLLSLLAVYGVRGLKEFLKIKKKRKGGADQ